MNCIRKYANPFLQILEHPPDATDKAKRHPGSVTSLTFKYRNPTPIPITTTPRIRQQ